MRESFLDSQLPPSDRGKLCVTVSIFTEDMTNFLVNKIVRSQKFCFIIIILRSRGSLTNLLIPLVGQSLHLDAAVEQVLQGTKDKHLSQVRRREERNPETRLCTTGCTCQIQAERTGTSTHIVNASDTAV